ncbi:MAG: PEP-CTERM system histidine kinase PrsK [Anaerolineae bacterium]|nr:PEP-CTERM system histidine kinase PrsK [Anaerolineae bacterium]
MYSDAMLYAHVNPAWWIARGFGNALLVPLMAVAVARNPQWKLDIAMSRQVVFHSAALFVAGTYLVLVAAGGYYVRYFGGQWGAVAQALVVFAALVVLAVIVASGSARARLRVFLSKHFFSYRFDYREQWLRLTRTLVGTEATAESAGLPQRVILALAQPVESPGGALWLREGDVYTCAATVAYRGSRAMIAATEPLIGFLAEREWVIDLTEWSRQPERYDGLPLPAALRAQGDAWLIVPLMLGNDLLGFVALVRPLASLPLDWEVRDLLKTAARQAASHLGVQRAVEELVQARQFESFNRMSAFVVHDLKNLVAQLGLMTKNAQRHRDNPEFQADMLATVENVMERMQGLLRQLRAGARPVEPRAPVALAAALSGALAARRGLHPEPRLAIDAELARASVLAHRDRLERVIGHLVQNAAEATGLPA